MLGKPHSQRVRVVNISRTSQRLHILGPTTDCFKVLVYAPHADGYWTLRSSQRDWLLVLCLEVCYFWCHSTCASRRLWEALYRYL